MATSWFHGPCRFCDFISICTRVLHSIYKVRLFLWRPVSLQLQLQIKWKKGILNYEIRSLHGTCKNRNVYMAHEEIINIAYLTKDLNWFLRAFFLHVFFCLVFRPVWTNLILDILQRLPNWFFILWIYTKWKGDLYIKFV